MAQATSSQRLLDKVCIVTGSSSGIGRAIALAYAGEGARLVCTDLRKNSRNDVESECSINTDTLIRDGGGRAIFFEADVSKADEVESMVKAAVAEYGRIDVLVNNAGISLEAGREPMRIHEVPESMFDMTMAVNVKSCFLASKYTISQMLRQEKLSSGDRGWIINLSSIFGIVGGANMASYATSKGAVSNLTRQIALDYAKDGIHCNAICPGFTNTAILADATKTIDKEVLSTMHPLQGFASPEDIAASAVFLASHEARWITGILLPVDGGFTAR